MLAHIVVDVVVYRLRAFETRPAYLASKSDYYTHCQDIPPQYGPGCGVPSGAPYEAAIDGRGPPGWCLPLAPLTAESPIEPYFVAGGVDEQAAREEAACKMLSNHQKVRTTLFSADSICLSSRLLFEWPTFICSEVYEIRAACELSV